MNKCFWEDECDDLVNKLDNMVDNFYKEIVIRDSFQRLMTNLEKNKNDEWGKLMAERRFT